MTLWQLKQALRKGAHPTALGGERLRNDTGNLAYRVGAFVVKKDVYYSCSKQTAREDAMGIARLAPTIRVNGWLIQLFYPRHQDGAWRVEEWERSVGSDIHYNNVGKDRRGRWVAFDW